MNAVGRRRSGGAAATECERRGQRGYALLAALVVVALAGMFAVTAVAAVSSSHGIGAADRARARATDLAWLGLDAASRALRADPFALSGDCAAERTGAGALGGYAASWEPSIPAAAGAWLAAEVTSGGETPAARAEVRALLELRLPCWCGGVSVAGDVELEAPVVAAGSGVCAGGCIRGRELLAFAPGAGSVALADGWPDEVHGDLWPVVAAHAGGTIWAGGEEVCTVTPAPYPQDTDTDTGSGGVERVTRGPGEALLAAFSEAAVASGDAFRDGVLDISLLPAVPPGVPGRESPSPAAGFIVVLPAADEPPRVVGVRTADACPLVVVAFGGCVVGGVERSAAPVTFRGALVCCGHLEVATPLTLDGHLYARQLQVGAPLVVNVASDWRTHPLTVLSTPTIVASE